ncbi:MAG: hypothetical protein ACOYCE_03110 [Limnochordia bacterium]|jgi:hypothetical protein|nr:hypothetical protein [Bacillota bacterium]
MVIMGRTPRILFVNLWVLILCIIILQPDLALARAKPGFLIPPLCRVLACTGEVVFTEQDIVAGRHEQDSIVVEKAAAITISIVSNSPYTIWLTTLSGTLHGPQGELPIGRLEWRCPQGEWVPVGNRPRSLRGFPPGSRSTVLDLRLKVYYTDPPGTYELETVLMPDLLWQ